MIIVFFVVVNGGILYKLYIVEKIIDSEGIVIMRNIFIVVRKVILEEVFEKMRSILEDIVEKGIGKRVYIEGYVVGGKIGIV